MTEFSSYRDSVLEDVGAAVVSPSGQQVNVGQNARTQWFQLVPRIQGEFVEAALVTITTSVTTGATTYASVAGAVQLDVIIYGTGFQATQFLTPMRVSGRGGIGLHEAWQDGAQAYLGITVSGFPNFFMLYGPNTNLGGNSIIYMLEGQIGYVLAAIRALEEHRLAWVDVRPDVQDAFSSWVQSASRKSVWESGCHSLVHHHTKLTLLVTERFPPKSIAYALTVLVPVIRVKVTDQLVQQLVVVAKLQALLFN